MAVRTDLTLDISSYKKSLNEADAAAIKYARKQEKNFQKQQRELKSIETSIKRLERAREASNNPKAVRQYTQAIEKLEREHRELRQETDKYRKGVKQSGDAAQKSAKKSESSFKKMGKAAKRWIAGVAIGALMALGEMLRRIGDEQIKFDKKMNESLAIMGDVSLATRNEMEKTARAVSNDLNIAADKAAESYYFLASAGFDARQSVEALPAVAEFATAGMFDMATATDLATDAQSALGLKSQDSAQNLRNLRRVTDVLVNANTDANASVQQFAESLTNRAAAELRNFNKDIEEGIGVLAAFADQGTKGRKSGEFLSRMLITLSDAASKNTEEFRDMGIVDAEGNLASMADIVEALTIELEGMSDTQVSARLKQLGFSKEVQNAIKPLLGASDAIREYEESAREAGGTTEEVADNQMKSLQDRAGELWQSLKNALGPPLTAILKKTLSDIQEIADAVAEVYTNISQSQTEELISHLEEAGGSPELITRLEKQQAITEAEDLKEDLQAEIEALTVPIDIEEKSFMNKFNDIVDPVFAMRLQGPWERLEELREGFQGLGEDFQLAEGEFDMENLSEYETMLEEARENLNMIGNTTAAMKEEGGDVPDALMDRMELYRDQISQLERAIDKAKQLESVQDSIDELHSSDVVDDNSPDQEDVKNTRSWVRTLREFGDQQNFMKRMAMLGDQIPKAELGEMATIIGDIDQQMREAAEGDVMGAQIRGAARAVEKYNQKLTRLNNLRDLGPEDGGIGDAEYQKRVNNATQEYLETVRNVYKTIKDELSPEQQELFEDLFGNVEDAEEKTEETESTLSDIADTADALINVADAFGQIGDQARKSLRGISDVLRNVEKLQGVSGLGAVVPAIGVAGGIASLLSGLFSDSESKTEAAELRNSMKELRRAVERNTEAYYEQSVVGSDVSQEQIDRGHELTSGLMEEWESIDWTEFLMGDESSMGGIRDRLSELGEMFPEIFGEHLEMFNNYLEQGDMESALQLLQDIPGQFEEIAGSVGEYGDSIQGAAKTFSDAIRYGGATVEEAFDQAADHILNNVATMEELDQEAINLIEEAKALDLDTEEGRERLKEIVETLFSNPQWRGDMTKEEWEEMLDLFLDASDEGSATSSEAEDEEFSQSAEIARSITDVQANEMIMFLERIEKWTRDTAAGVGSKTAVGVNESGGLMPDLSIPVPLPVEITNDRVPVEAINEVSGGGDGRTRDGGGDSDSDDDRNGDGRTDQRQQKSMNVNVGGVQVGRDEISDEEIDEIGRRFTDKLKREIRSSQF